MAYIPKSNIKISYTNSKDKFVYANSITEEYHGSYIETANGKYFAGTNPLKLDIEIIPKTYVNRRSTKEGLGANNFTVLGTSTSFKKHRVLSPLTYDLLKQKETPVIQKNIPTPLDYNKGYFYRFFLNRVNDPQYYKEINKKTFESIRDKKSNYDFNLYRTGQIKWSLAGNTYEKNKKQIKLTSQLDDFPFLHILFPLLNEYTQPRIINNQFANPGELYYLNNPEIEYVGPYHIHPEKGPMVGAQHVQEPHEQLTFASINNDVANLLQIYGIDSTNFLNYESDPENFTTEDIQTPSPPPPTNMGTSGTSGGGGGGY